VLGIEPGLWIVVGGLLAPVVGGVAVAATVWLRRRLDPVAQGRERRRLLLEERAAGLSLAEAEPGRLEGVVGGRRVAVEWGRQAAEPGAVPSEVPLIAVLLDAPPPGGLAIQSREPVPGARVPRLAVSGGAEVLARPGVEAGLRELSERGGLRLVGRRLELRLAVGDDAALEPVVERLVQVARGLEHRAAPPVAEAGLGAVAAGLGWRETAEGFAGEWRGRRVRALRGTEAAELHMELGVELPAGLQVVARDAPAGLRARAEVLPVPLPLDAAALPWRVSCGVPAAARELLARPEVRAVLEGIVDARGGRLAGGAVVRVVSPAVLGLAPQTVLGPLREAVAVLEAAVLGPLQAVADRWGLQLGTEQGRAVLAGAVRGVELRLEAGRAWELRARPTAGLRQGLDLRPRRTGERGGRGSGNPILDAAVVVSDPEGGGRGLEPALVLPLVAGRGSRVRGGVLLWSGTPLAEAALQELLEEVWALVPTLSQ
jgi:hypothetical protein